MKKTTPQTKCILCGKPRREHNAMTKGCPMKSSRKTIWFSEVNKFTPLSAKK